MSRPAVTARSLAILAAIALHFLPPSANAAVGTDAPTFSRDVAPIFFDKCAKCHRPGEVAPMSLLSYEAARPWAKSIVRAVRNRDMPPFSGDSDHYTWTNDIRLSEEQIATITTWVRQGARRGDPADLPELPRFSDGWTVGEPDLILTLDRVDVPADGEDLFPIQRHEIELATPRWVRAIEFRPGDRRVTHHFQATYNSPSEAGGGVFAIWTAGMPPYVFPEGMGRVLHPGTTVQLDMHYHPMGEATSDVSMIGVYFGEGELQKEVATIPVANMGLRIPPGADHHAELAHYLFDKDMQILALSPHMHVRGKAMRYELTHPDGTRETLLDVPNYDYNWQWLYYPTEPIDVAAGSRMDVEAVWDNSENNPANPDPSREIIYRGDVFNEMFVGFLEVIQKDGVLHEPQEATTKISSLLALHPPESSYLVDGFFKMGFHVPREGEGWLYLGNRLAIFSITLDDFEWRDNELEITTQFPTPDASAMTTVIHGTVGDDGRFTGHLIVGTDTSQPRKLPIVGMPFAASGAATGAGD